MTTQDTIADLSHHLHAHHISKFPNALRNNFPQIGHFLIAVHEKGDTPAQANFWLLNFISKCLWLGSQIWQDFIIIKSNQTLILGKDAIATIKTVDIIAAWAINLELQVFMSSTIISSHE